MAGPAGPHLSGKGTIVGELLKLVPPAPRAPNHDAVQLVEGLLERVKSGRVQAAALVQVEEDGGVGTAYSQSDCWHHHLCSGAARLALRVAGVRDDA